MNAIIISAILGVIMMFLSAFKSSLKSFAPFAIIGFAILLTVNILEFNNIDFFKIDTKNMLNVSKVALLFNILVTGCALLYLLLSSNFIEVVGKQKAEYFALIFFIFCGIYILSSYSSLLMLFLGIEIISIPLYILTGSDKNNLKSNEASLKYFLMGAFSTGILLLGIAFIYGSVGTFNLSEMNIVTGKVRNYDGSEQFGVTTWTAVGAMFVFAALSFKVSAAPFHFWTPDVYDGAPTVFTSFMATFVKAAFFIAFIKLFHDLFGIVTYKWIQFAALVTALTLLIGNVTALFQQSVKRMLAYSSIAQAGFMLFAVMAVDAEQKAYEGIMLYTVAYSLATVGLFTVLLHLKDYTFDGFNGLAKRQPTLAFVATICLLSLAGIPLTAGFFAKYYMLTAAISSGVYVWLIIIALLGAAISVYYYFKVIQAMYFKNSTNVEEIKVETNVKYALFATIAIIIIIGIFPNLITSWL
jgi:NADH-quinone oxidoreductase subunit N